MTVGFGAWLSLLVTTLPESQSLWDGLLILTLDTLLILMLTGAMAWVVDLAFLAAGLYERASQNYLK